MEEGQLKQDQKILVVNLRARLTGLVVICQPQSQSSLPCPRHSLDGYHRLLMVVSAGQGKADNGLKQRLTFARIHWSVCCQVSIRSTGLAALVLLPCPATTTYFHMPCTDQGCSQFMM